ncbi:MAG TPA: energy transducer TonB [Mucilaginibacter sp.]|jgi:protein TonB|nr:energy transducer TonB [Mucilaginibacter sp.]
MMKLLSILILFLFSVFGANAQKTDTLKKPTSDTSIYASPEHLPEFPGGIDQFMSYVGKNIRYPADARAASKQGKVILQFIVEKDGSISKVKVLRSVFPSIDAEAVRVVTSSPKWAPGTQDGYPVRVRYTIPVTFNISNKVYFLKD